MDQPRNFRSALPRASADQLATPEDGYSLETPILATPDVALSHTPLPWRLKHQQIELTDRFVIYQRDPDGHGRYVCIAVRDNDWHDLPQSGTAMIAIRNLGPSYQP